MLESPTDFPLPLPLLRIQGVMNAHFQATVVGIASNRSLLLLLLLLLHTNVNPSRNIFFILSGGILPHYFSSEQTDGVHSV